MATYEDTMNSWITEMNKIAAIEAVKDRSEKLSKINDDCKGASAEQMLLATEPVLLGKMMCAALDCRCTRAVDILERIMGYLPAKEYSPVLAEVFRHMFQMDPEKIESLGANAELAYAHVSALTGTLKHKMSAAHLPVDAVWHAFCKRPHPFYAAILGPIGDERLTMGLKPAQKRLKDLLHLTKAAKSVKPRDSGKVFTPAVIDVVYDMLADNILPNDGIAVPLLGDVLTLMEVCKTETRGPWAKASGSRISIERRVDANYDNQFLPAKNVELTHRNKTIWEHVIYSIYNLLINSSDDSSLKRFTVEITSKQRDWMLDRFEAADSVIESGKSPRPGAPDDETAVCEAVRTHARAQCTCCFDMITNTLWQVIIQALELDGGKKLIRDDCRLINWMAKHLNTRRFSSLVNLIPVARDPVLEHSRDLFTFAQNVCPYLETTFKFFVALTQHSPSSLMLEHADFLDYVGKSEDLPDSRHLAAFKALEAIAVNRPELMRGKGDGYYGITHHALDHADSSVPVIDNILRCVGRLPSEQEAARALGLLMTEGLSLVPGPAHVNSVARAIRGIAEVHREQVDMSCRTWAERVRPQAPKEIEKLMAILDKK